MTKHDFNEYTFHESFVHQQTRNFRQFITFSTVSFLAPNFAHTSATVVVSLSVTLAEYARTREKAPTMEANDWVTTSTITCSDASESLLNSVGHVVAKGFR